MAKQMRVALWCSLLLAGVALLLVGQAQLGDGRAQGVWALAGGLLLLIGGAALAWYQRHGRRPPPLVGEYRGVLASEDGFVPLRGAAAAQRQQTQQRVVGKPEHAAESVRRLLAEQLRQGKASPPPNRQPGKRRKGDG